MPPALRDPIPDEYSALQERLTHEAKSLTNGDPGSPDNVQRRGNIDACIAKLQVIAALKNVDATAKLSGATWAMFWVSVLLVFGNIVLALATFAQAGWFKRT